MPRYALAFTLALTACSSDDTADTRTGPLAPGGATYDVYFLGGQSNMDGYGFVADLPPDLREPHETAVVFNGRPAEDGQSGGGAGLWVPLGPGHGSQFSTDGKSNVLSDRFGPEITFGHAMDRGTPGRRVALIKFARGGTGLVDGVSGFGSWDPDYAKGNGRNQYDNALTAISQALAARDVDGDGRRDTLVPAGIVWMQGEADAFDSKTASSNYAANLARLMTLFRDALDDDRLPVVIGQIKDSGDTAETRVMRYSPEVRAAQAQYVSDDRCAALVTATDGFEFLPDGWHYTSKDYVTLGNAFAKAMTDLKERCE